MTSFEKVRPSLDGIKQASTNAFDKAKLMVGLKQEEDEESQQTEQSGLLEEVGDLICPDLTFQQRLIGFVTCFTLGYLITFMSFKFFIRLIEGNPIPFAANYTGGNVLSLGASWFLCGPKRQFRNMFDQKRKYTSMIYLTCLLATLVVVFIPFPWALQLALLILLLVVQFSASMWYSLSYIPYGRRAFVNTAKRVLGLYEAPLQG